MTQGKPFCVLSIDFDVFQAIPSQKHLNVYPIGIDRTQEESCRAWRPFYEDVTSLQLLQEVKINEEKVEAAARLIENGCAFETPIMVANSHKDILKWILEHYNAKTHPGIFLTHLDAHHDLFNENEKLDCGNWISFLKKEVPNTHIKWVCNAISKEIYGLSTPEFDFINDEIEPLIGQTYDLLFICRSDTWLPPHLDPAFTAFCERALCVANVQTVEPNILIPRKIKEQ